MEVGDVFLRLQDCDDPEELVILYRGHVLLMLRDSYEHRTEELS
jgi:hypothetical protein